MMDRLVVPVKFTLSADRQGFEITYIDMEPFHTSGDPFTRHGFEKDPQVVLAFI